MKDEYTHRETIHKTLKGNLEKITDVFEKCIKINNEYKLKHEELKEIYNAYSILVENCDSEYIQTNLFKILTDIDRQLITKETLKELITDQSNMMKEFNHINVKIQELYPNYA